MKVKHEKVHPVNVNTPVYCITVTDTITAVILCREQRHVLILFRVITLYHLHESVILQS